MSDTWTWNRIGDVLPPCEHVVELAVVSPNGGLYRAYGCREDTGEGWLWALSHYGPTDDWRDCEADDDYRVWAWREPTPLPEAPPKGWNGAPYVIDPPERGR